MQVEAHNLPQHIVGCDVYGNVVITCGPLIEAPFEVGEDIGQHRMLRRRHQDGSHRPTRLDQRPHDQRRFGDEEPSLRLDATPELRIGQPDVVDEPRIRGVIDANDGHPLDRIGSRRRDAGVPKSAKNPEKSALDPSIDGANVQRCTPHFPSGRWRTLVNRSQLLNTFAEANELTRKDADALVTSLLEIITNSVASGDDVAISGFAKFKRIDRPARMARNPATGEQVRVKAKRVARITPLKNFKDAVLSGKASKPAAKKAPAKKKAVAKKAPAKKKAVAKKAPAKKAPAKKKAVAKKPAKRR
jgi:DNA-binding protein HU-beta